MTNPKDRDIVPTETRNNTFTERNRIMKTFISAIPHLSVRQAIFQYQEYSFAKRTHFQDKQKYRTGMSSRG